MALRYVREIQTRLTFLTEGARSPVWSPDGRSIAFGGLRQYGLYIKDVSGGGDPRRILEADAAIMANCFGHRSLTVAALSRRL